MAGTGAALGAGEKGENEVAPAEDRMREHGVLNRVLLLYEEFLRRASAPRKEHRLFGEDGFEKLVEKVAGIETRLGIYDLAKFTPVV